MAQHETMTSQFELSQGTRQDTSLCILAVEPRKRAVAEARKGRLYIALETDPGSTGGAAACQLIVRTIPKTFYQDDSYSTTASLRESIRVANEALYKHNFTVPRERRAFVGITCAVVKEQDIFFAQVMPGQAYVLADNKLRALPTHPSWQSAHISPAPFLKASALGTSLFVDPELSRCRWQDGDSLMLCSSNIAHLLSSTDVQALLRQEPPAAIEQLYQLCSEQALPEARAIVVRLLPQPQVAAHSRPASHQNVWQKLGSRMGFSRTNEAPSAANRPRTAPEADGPGRPSPPGRAAHETDLRQALPEEPPALVPPFPPKTLPIDPGESLEERQQQAEQERDAHLPPSALLGEEGYEQAAGVAQQPIDLSDLSLLSSHAQPYRSRFERRPPSDMKMGERLLLPFRWVSAVFGDRSSQQAARRKRPVRKEPINRGQPVRLQQQQQQQTKSIRFSLMILTILVLAVTLLIVYGLSLSQQGTQDRIVQYFEEAENRMETVFAADNREQAAEELADAEQAMRAIRSSPLVTVTNATFWLRYQDLQSEYEQALSSIHRITYLDDLEVLAEHPLPGGRFASIVVPRIAGTVTATHLLEARNYVYTIDGNSEMTQLYRIPIEGGQPETYLSPNDVVRSTIVGPIRAIAWRIDNVIAIDQGNNGFGYYLRDSDGWNHIRLGGSEIWSPRGRIDLETYQGNLYVWGAEPNEILRFASGRYGDIPTLWIDPTNLQGHDIGPSIDMAIDGNIYLLQPDGRIFVLFQGGFLREILPQELVPPLTTVTRFFLTGSSEEGWIFLLDTMNERIVQIDKTSGRVIQQAQTRPDSDIRLNQLTDIFVQTDNGKPILYLINGNQMLRATLPNPPAPFTPTSDNAASNSEGETGASNDND